MIMGKKRPQDEGLVVDDITVAYRSGLTALRHASFSVPRGTITALVGVNLLVEGSLADRDYVRA